MAVFSRRFPRSAVVSANTSVASVLFIAGLFACSAGFDIFAVLVVPRPAVGD